MADRRAARSGSRRKTPTPQPSSKVNTAQTGRAPRTRGLRSASRDIDPNDVQKPTRRSARQASVATETDVSENDAQPMRKTKRRAAKEPVGG